MRARESGVRPAWVPRQFISFQDCSSKSSLPPVFLTLFTQGQELWCITPRNQKKSKHALCQCRLQDTGELSVVGDPAKASSEGGLSVGLLTLDGHLDFILEKLWAPRPSIFFTFRPIRYLTTNTLIQIDTYI